jgi:hypothetical protein
MGQTQEGIDHPSMQKVINPSGDHGVEPETL